MKEKNMFIRKSAEAFIYSVFFLSCATLTRSAMLIKCSKKLYFSKELILIAAFCRGYTVWIAFAGFIAFAVNLYYI